MAALEEVAATEEARRLDEAASEAARLLAAAQAEAAAAAERRRHEARRAAEQGRAEIQAATLLRQATCRAEVRESLLERLFERASQVLSEARLARDYPCILQRLLAEALDDLPLEQDVVVRCDARDLSLLNPVAGAAGRPIAVERILNAWGGLVVQDLAGRVVADNTIESRLQRARETLWPRLAAILLPEAGESAPAPVPGR